MAQAEQHSDFPQWWDWDNEGDTVDGTFLRVGRGFTAQGDRTFVVLDIGGDERTVWLHHSVLQSAFSRELYRRPDQEFKVGEKIVIRQLGTRDSESGGRSYMNYRVEFPDGPKDSQADIFGPPPEPPAYDDTADVKTDKPESDAGDDGIPF